MEAPPPMEDVPRSSTDSSSPEFEFWMVGNHPSSPDTHILTADELFVDGVLLPLHRLSLPRLSPDPEPEPEPEHNKEAEPASDLTPAEPSASICSPAVPAASSSSGSKRWKDIFKVGEKKSVEKEKRKDRKGNAGGSAELRIGIWPFSRSRSAGNAARPRAASAAGRKASSAPCSRSNSRGESSKPAASAGSARRWAASPGRPGLSGGVHLGRSNPVWQLRRSAKVGETPASKEKAAVPGGGGGRRGGGPLVLSLNVNTCIGYGNQVSCRDGDGGSNGSLFNLKTLFTKKVY